MITATDLTTTNSTVIYESVGESGVTTLIICNHHATTDTLINVWVVPDGAVAGNANQILKNLNIVASDTFVMDMEKLVLNDGDTIVAQADTANIVNAVISSMAVA